MNLKGLALSLLTLPAQARWLSLSSNAKQIFAHNSSEYIQFDEPDTVIDAIREVYDHAKLPPSAQKMYGRKGVAVSPTVVPSQNDCDSAAGSPCVRRTMKTPGQPAISNSPAERIPKSQCEESVCRYF